MTEQASNAEQARDAALQAREAARQAAQTAREAAKSARDAAREGQPARVVDPADPASPPDPPIVFHGIRFGDGTPSISADLVDGNIVLRQEGRTASIPWRDAVPSGAVAIAWAIPATLSIFVIWWPLTRALTGWLRRKTAVAHDTAALEARLRERFELIERNVDTVAIEMERLAEGQRFTNKLLSERQAVPVDASRP
jgi:hypothetical protein